MKKEISFQFALIVLGLFFMVNKAISQNKTVIGVVTINSIKMPYSVEELTDATRNSLEKLNLYLVVDKYDQKSLAEKNKLDLSDCLSKSCLIEAGRVLETTHILTGSVENFGKKIIVKLRLFNVETKEVEKFKIIEYLDLKDQIQTILDISVKSLFELPVDKDLMEKLTKEFAFETALNTPESKRVDLSGPRLGITVLTGETAKIFKSPKIDGGYDAIPVLTQFGYQFEINYLNEGNFQALFEIIPVIVGLDQSLFVPVLNLLNGLRSSKSGLEFGFGPQISVVKKARGYYDEGDKFILLDHGDPPDGFTIEERLHSKGNLKLSTTFLFGIGKTFKSGTLNMPVNIFYKPAKNAHQFGISVGYNVSRNKKSNK